MKQASTLQIIQNTSLYNYENIIKLALEGIKLLLFTHKTIICIMAQVKRVVCIKL